MTQAATRRSMSATLYPFARPSAATPTTSGDFDHYTDAQLFAAMECGGPAGDGAASVLLARHGSIDAVRRLRREWLDGAA